MRLRVALLIVAVLGAATFAALYAVYLHLDRTPGELLRALDRRLIGHPNLAKPIDPLIRWTREHIERPVTGLDGPLIWRGAGATPVSESTELDGKKRAAANVRAIQVGSVPALISAIGSARPGDVIEIMPGRYQASGRSIATRASGSPSAPITVRAQKLGDVLLEFNMLEGFHVLHESWIFENLEIAGVCGGHSDCEHAFHIVGGARSVVIRNNRIRDFNAHIKINGADKAYPDGGLIQSNTIFNTRPRNTANPVTPVDIVAASNWRVTDNFIADFVKADGDQTSYGAFMKGAGSGGRFERNIVICALALQRQPGLRVGLSFGGGGTNASSCRGGDCAFEHQEGFMVNNIVAHCNDSGLDVNRSSGVTIAHNTLINTPGIDIRNAPASGVISNNLLEGRLRQRAGGWFVAANNRIGDVSSLLRAPDRLNFQWQRLPASVPAVPAATHDICGASRTTQTLPGAVLQAASCLKSPM